MGYKAAQLMAPELEKYALNDADWEAYIAQRQARRRTKIPTPQFVEIYGITGMQQGDINARFEKFINKPINSIRLRRASPTFKAQGCTPPSTTTSSSATISRAC